jgi:predicted RND superfamily exporter protein
MFVDIYSDGDKMFGTKKRDLVKLETDAELNPGDALVRDKGGEKYIIVIPGNQSEALKELEHMIDYIVAGTNGVESIEKIIKFVNNKIKDNPSWKGDSPIVDLDTAIKNMEGGEAEKTIILYLLLKYKGYDVYYNEGTKTYYDFTKAPKNMTINREKYKVNISNYPWLTLNTDGKHYLIDLKSPFLIDAEMPFATYKKEPVQIIDANTLNNLSEKERRKLFR